MAGQLCFASDYDGTLVHGPGIPSVQDRAAVDRFREEGGLFGLNTGRTRRGLAASLKDRLPLDFVILMSGALVLDAQREVIWERRMPRDVAAEIVGRFRLRALGLFLVAGNEYWTTSPVSLVRRSRGTFNVVRRFSMIPDPIFGVAFRMLTLDAASGLASRINRDFGSVATAYQNGKSVDVVSAGCSKATGLEVVRRELGVRAMAAMGDSYNDIPMLRAADVGYTFPSSPAEVRDAAVSVLPSVGAALADFSLRMHG